MIRNRDLFIFVGILLLLCFAIAVTIFRDEWGSLHTASLSFNMGTSSASTDTYSAVIDEKTINREENIARLREALAKNETLVEPDLNIVSSAPADLASTSSAPSDADKEVQKCGGEDSTKYIHGWPLSGVAFKEESGLRIASLAHPEPAQGGPVATSSALAALASERVLLEVPIAPIQLPSPHCVPSDAIGVTTSGSLIFNSDATFYRGYGAEFLIGYARDGYPIYGYYQGAVDACGGYMAATGYRYTVSAERNFIIGCFMATPSPFVGL